MDRRSVLRTAGLGLAWVAGCTAIGTPRSGDGSTGGRGGSVAFGALQPSIVELHTDDLSVPETHAQYLYLDVDVPADDAPERTAFGFRFDGHEYAPRGRDLPPLYRNRVERRYDAESGSGWLLFRLPATGDAADARLAVGSHVWQPSDSVVERLSNPHPTIDVDVSFPDAVAIDASPSVTITADNGSDTVAGRFVAGLSRSGPSVARIPVALVSERVSPGTRETFEVTDETGFGSVRDDHLDDGDPDVRYVLDWESGSDDGAVRLVA